MEANKLPKKHEPSSDRITHLPNALLLHILSFLPTKTAVQTCVLSKQWRYLWTSILFLDFDDKSFPFPTYQRKNINFMGFVDKVLMLRDCSDLYKLRLSYKSCYCDRRRAYIWIRSAVRSNVRELDLKIRIIKGPCFEFPGCVFTSETLAVLKLDLKYGVLKLPTGIGFGRLKALHLYRVGFGNQNLEFLSKCPLLEYLNIDRCVMNNLDIFAPQLKTLIIVNSDNREIRIRASSLVSFSYIGLAPEQWDLENLSSLVDAVLDINVYCDGDDVTHIIQSVSKAEALTLSRLFILILAKAPNILEFLPTPNYNLKYLKLFASRSMFDHIQVIAWLLKHYINLETLAIDIGKSCHSSANTFYCSDLPFECPLDHLKEVVIRHFGDCEDELQFVRFLLERAKVLKKMVIFTSRTGWTYLQKQRVINKLMAFSKASSCVTILLS